MSKPIRKRTVEIVRSYSYKLQCEAHGGAKYESRDFFASQKAECYPHQAAEVSSKLHAFCKAEVLAAVRQEIAAIRAGEQLPGELVPYPSSAPRRTA
jgi:hypothetical protein